ncbi:MAG: formate/nitrite transporter family protein [Kiritimatiellia bacterium]
MFDEALQSAGSVAVTKRTFLRENPLGYIIASMLAGAYVGLGIILIFAIGGPLAAAGHPAQRLVMGASFGIALTLVVFAGSELYTGNTMFMSLGWLRKEVKLRDVGLVWLVSWTGNLIGALALSWLVVQAGSLLHAQSFIQTVAGAKTTAPAHVLFASGVLCNLLVCLALWTASRTKADTAKIILINLCLFAFIASGFEHSIANMTLLGIGVLYRAGTDLSWAGYFYNLLWVTLGNTLAGAVILAGAYHLMAKRETKEGVPL